MKRIFRVVNNEVVEVTGKPYRIREDTAIVSDNNGFPEQCLADRQTALAASGVQGIEFKRDPKVPEFYQCHASSWGAMDRYSKSRGLVNRTGSLGGGAMLNQDAFDKAKELVSR